MRKHFRTLVAIGTAAFFQSALAAPETPLWTKELDGNISSSVAIGTNLYVGAADGTVKAIDPSTGAEVWSFETKGYVGATPVISADGNTLYIASYDENLYAVDAATGLEKWRFTTVGSIFASPALDETGMIYVTTKYGSVYLVDPVSGTELGSTNVGAAIDSSPAIMTKGTETYLYFGSLNGGVYAIDVDSGSMQWMFTDTGGLGMSSPVIGPDNTVYIGSHDGYVYALNASDGTLKWKQRLNGRVASSLSINKNTLYCASYDFGTLYAIDMATGKVWWEYQTGGEVFSTAAVGGNGKVYIGTKTKLLAINETSGALAWSYTADSPVVASPVIDAANGQIYGITQNGTLFALTGDGTTPASSSWSMFRQNKQRSGAILDADNDGMADAWETAHGVTDPAANTDGDTLTNLQEYLAGTLPSNPDTDGDGSYDGVDSYPTRTGTPASFLALADRLVTGEDNSISILGIDLMANDSNPEAVALSITDTTNTYNTVNTKPTVSSGNLSYNPGTATSQDEFAYTLSGGSHTRSGLVSAKIAASTDDVVGTSADELVFAGGNNKNTDGGGGNDIIYDDADGDDHFLFDQNSGNDRLFINDALPRNDYLWFKSSVDADDINLYKDGKNLIYHIRESDQSVNAIKALKNPAKYNVTKVKFANGVDADWDLSKIKAVHDRIQVTSTDGVITFTPNTMDLLTQNDYIPPGAQIDMEIVPGSSVGGTAVMESSWVDWHVVFTLDTGVTSGSFEYRLVDQVNPAITTTATVNFQVVGNNVSSASFYGNGYDDDVLMGTPGDDYFDGGPGFDIIDAIGGEDTVDFAIGSGKDTFYYMWDDGGTNGYGDTINMVGLNLSDVRLERQGLDLVATVKANDANVRMQDNFWQEASINSGMGLANGLLPFNQMVFANSTLNAATLRSSATGNATASCSGGSSGASCIGTSGADGALVGTNSTSSVDVMFGLGGDDAMNSYNGDDYMYGGAGNDYLYNFAGDSEMYGDEGNDILWPSTGNDYLNGGGGKDWYSMHANFGNNVIDNLDLTINPGTGAGRDFVHFENPTTQSQVKFKRVHDDLVFVINDGTNISTNTVLDYFSFSGYSELDFKFITSGGGWGGAVIWDGSCIDQVTKTGTPSVSNSWCVKARVLYDMGADDTGSDPAIDDDILIGYDGAETIDGNLGNDIIYGGAGLDTITGGSGHDTIYPGWGSDVVHGNTGNDKLHGSDMYGVAKLYGDEGNDDYIFSDNQYGTINDIVSGDSGVDRIQLLNDGLETHNYWFYISDYDADGTADDLVIAIIGFGTQVGIRNWNDGNNQVGSVEVGSGSGCLKINRAQFSSYMAAIVTLVGSGIEPTTTQMDTVIGGGSYWTSCGS